MSGSDDVAAMLAASQRVIDAIQRGLDDSDEAIRAMGFDPEKVRVSMAAHLSPKEKEEAARLVEQDLADVERDVEEARARSSFASAKPNGGRRPRRMV